MKRTTLLPYAIAATAAVLFSGAAQAQDWKVTGEFGWFGVGKAYEYELERQYLSIARAETGRPSPAEIRSLSLRVG